MSRRVVASVVAGLIAGVPMGIAMQMMQAPTPDGSQMPMMAMVARVVHSDSLAVGWLYHLFNSAVIGGLFGWWFGSRATGLGNSLGLGAVHGVIWWVLGGLVLMPLLLGKSPFAPLAMPMMRPVAMGSLMGHLLYGLVLGGVYSWLFRARPELQSQMRGAAGHRG